MDEPHPFSHAPSITLQGPNLTLTTLIPEWDHEELYAASHGDATHGDDLWLYMPFGPFSPTSFKNFLFELLTTRIVLVAIDRKSGRKIGMVSYMNNQPEHKSVELGSVWISYEFQGTYATTEMIFLALHQAFDVWKYRRVEWRCNTLNIKSYNVALKLGFKLEGLFRQHMIVKGQNRDTAFFSIIDVEWPIVRENIVNMIKKRTDSQQWGHQLFTSKL